MEIALGGLVVLIALLPGISFRKSYFSGEFSKQYTVKDFFELFINTLIPSFIIYGISYPIVRCAGYDFNFEVLLGLLSSESTISSASFKNIDEFKTQIFSYQFIVNICSFLIGLLTKRVVIRNSLDTEIDFLRYKNIWHYLISGRFILFPRSQISLQNNTIEDVDITYIDALVSVGESAFHYTGLLVDYELSSDGSLDL